MRIVLFSFLAVLFTSCITTNYYVVRHAEKQVDTTAMTSDVPLSAQGQQRAIALGELLKDKKIKQIYSTNFIRTKATAQPLSAATGINVQLYDPKDSLFAPQLRKVKQNVLVVGHSNTVDNIVNGLMGKSILKDLPDTQYGDLFIVKKKLYRYTLITSHFGE